MQRVYNIKFGGIHSHTACLLCLWNENERINILKLDDVELHHGLLVNIGIDLYRGISWRILQWFVEGFIGYCMSGSK